jgi:hypothetical protein
MYYVMILKKLYVEITNSHNPITFIIQIRPRDQMEEVLPW